MTLDQLGPGEESGVTQTGKTKNFTMDTIFLAGECKRSKPGQTKVGAVRSCSLVLPINSCVSIRQNGSHFLSMYSPGERRKMNGMMIMLVAAQKVLSTKSDIAKTAIQQMTVIGMGLTQSGAGSICFTLTALVEGKNQCQMPS